jgi:ribose-phosphate pyrophosphokinase
MLILPLPGNEGVADELRSMLGAQLGAVETRRFPDGETYVRVLTEVVGADVALVCTLARPDEQFLRLVFTARTLRERGAARLVLVAPYLSYMRQDRAFQVGEAVTSAHFASLISREFDALVTVDPHLHRRSSLREIYTIPGQALHAAPLLAAWIAGHVHDALVIGPDVESQQWVTAVAADSPSVVLAKERRGDREVRMVFPDLSAFRGRRPVLVDDVVSSGHTMVEACKGLAARGFDRPVCLTVHAVFAEDAFDRLSEVAKQIVSTDTIQHPSNAISIAPLLAQAISGALINAPS